MPPSPQLYAILFYPMVSFSTLWYPLFRYGILPSVWYGTVSGLWWLCFPLPTTLWYPLPAMVCYHQFGMVQQWSMVALLGTNNPYNRSSGPPCRLLYFCTHHSIICHSESYRGLMGKPSLHNQASRLLISRLFPMHFTCPFIIRRVIADYLWSKRNHFVQQILLRYASNHTCGWVGW